MSQRVLTTAQGESDMYWRGQSCVRGIGALCAVVTFAWPAAAQAPELAMLATLEKGSWTLERRDDGAEQRLCVRQPRDFIQLRHHQTGCTQFVVEDKPDHVEVQYTCLGHGYGRTSIRKESAKLVQVRSQGILNGAPFSIEGEARRTGPC